MASPTSTSATRVRAGRQGPATPRAAGAIPSAAPPAAEVDQRGTRAAPQLIASATLTGIVLGPDGPLALVETPDGLGYILRAGDGIGEARLIRIGRRLGGLRRAGEHGPAGEQIVLALGPAK